MFLLLNREKCGPVDKINIGIYLRANKGARFTGLAFAVDYENETVEIISEFSFWPIGWVFSFDKQSLEGALDITSWLNEGYFEKKEMNFEIPCKWAVLGYPKDFRTPDEIQKGK